MYLSKLNFFVLYIEKVFDNVEIVIFCVLVYLFFFFGKLFFEYLVIFSIISMSNKKYGIIFFIFKMYLFFIL